MAEIKPNPWHAAAHSALCHSNSPVGGLAMTAVTYAEDPGFKWGEPQLRNQSKFYNTGVIWGVSQVRNLHNKINYLLKKISEFPTHSSPPSRVHPYTAFSSTHFEKNYPTDNDRRTWIFHVLFSVSKSLDLEMSLVRDIQRHLRQRRQVTFNKPMQATSNHMVPGRGELIQIEINSVLTAGV